MQGTTIYFKQTKIIMVDILNNNIACFRDPKNELMSKRAIFC